MPLPNIFLFFEVACGARDCSGGLTQRFGPIKLNDIPSQDTEAQIKQITLAEGWRIVQVGGVGSGYLICPDCVRNLQENLQVLTEYPT